MRLMLLWLTLLTGCATIVNTHGAATLSPGERTTSTALAVHNGDRGPLELPGWVTIGGQAQVAKQWGISPDFDAGGTLSFGGLYGNVRYRFYRNNFIQLALMPQIGGTIVTGPPWGLIADTRTYLLADFDFSHRWSITSHVGPRMRQNVLSFGKGEVEGLVQNDIFIDFGLRTVWKTQRHNQFAIGSDYFVDPVRKSRMGWIVSIQWQRGRSGWENRMAKDARRKESP